MDTKSIGAVISYRYKIFRSEPRTIYVRPNGRWTRWKIWGCFDTPEPAQNVLLLLRNANDERKESEIAEIVLP